MEDQVPFKVFTYLNETSKPEVRRFGIDKAVVTNFHYLNAKLQEIYPVLTRKHYTIGWKDEDGDFVIISSDEEILTALSALQGNLVKLHVIVKNEEVEKDEDCEIVISVADNPTVGPCPATHYGVACDGCNGLVVGYRYKCVSCDDFDLCSKCEAKGLHPEHCMVRVPSPTMSRTLIKAAIKRSRSFFKSVAHAGSEEHHKRHRRDRSGDRKSPGDRCHGDRHHGNRHHGERHHDDRNHGDHHRRRPRSSWLDTFATYMNEFANLAGDVGIDSEEPKVPQPKPQQTQQEKPTSSPDQAQAPKQPEPGTSEMPSCPMLDLKHIPKIVEMYLKGNLAPLIEQYAQQFEQSAASAGEQATTSTNNEATTSTSAHQAGPSVNIQQTTTPADAPKSASPATNQQPSPSATTNDDVVMSQVDPKYSEADNVSVETDVSTTSSEHSAKVTFGDKIDGWTVINKESDLMEAVAQPSAPNGSGSIGFDLPQEFQQRVGLYEQSIYPPLNTATAVLNPKEPERNLQEPLKPQPASVPQHQAQPTAGVYPQHQAAAGFYTQRGTYPHPGSYPQPGAYPQAGSYPQPGQNPQAAANAQAQTRPLHPKPNIAAALQQMLAMGFTNDGGWLTQLLETTNGDVTAVIEMLSPIKPNK